MISSVQSQLTQAQLTPAALGAQISIAIAAKSLDAQKQEGTAVLQLLDNAGQVADGVAPSPTGRLLDVQA